MQLKSLAKTQDALIDIDNLKNAENEFKALKDIGESYTTETLKAAIAQSTLKREQIETILSANGLQGELLETTTEELANAVTTNMVAKKQKETTGTTLGLGTAFEGLWISIKKATAAMVKFLFTTPAGWATLAVGAFTTVVLGVKQYRENITKAAEESKNAINEITDSYKNLNSAANDVKKRYAELAQCVDQFTGKNKNLSNEEYAEFLDLSNQLAELFHSLTKRYDENGNAILNLSGNVDTIVDSLSNLVEVEKQLANKNIIDELPNVLKGYNQNRSDLESELKNLEEWQHYLEVAYKSLKDINKVYTTGFLNNNSGYLEAIHVLSELGIEHETINYEEGFGFGTIALEDYDDSLDKISKSLKTATLDISNLNSKIKAENAEFNKYLSSWLFDNWSYVNLDPELQNVIQEMLFNTDWLSEAKSQGVNTKKWDKVSEWIEKNYISAIANIDDNAVKSALVDLYTIPTDDQSISKFVEQFNTAIAIIKTYCKEIAVKEIHTIDDFVINYPDYFIASGQTVEYAIVNVLNGSESNYATTKITPKFSKMFLIENGTVWGTGVTDGYCNTTRNIPSSNVELLNHRYPIFVRNTIANYDTGTCTGSFVPFADENSCELAYDSHYDYQRVKYQKEFMDFITDGIPKILKMPDGRMWIIQVTPNPADNANRQYNDREMSWSWVEVGDVNSEEDLYYLGLSNVSSEWWNQ